MLVDAGCEVADIETLLALDLRAHLSRLNPVCAGELAEVEEPIRPFLSLFLRPFEHSESAVQTSGGIVRSVRRSAGEYIILPCPALRLRPTDPSLLQIGRCCKRCMHRDWAYVRCR